MRILPVMTLFCTLLASVDACAAIGIKQAMIASSGFADAGEAGAALQRQLIEKARTLGIRIARPNTQGFYNVPRGIAATFSPAVNIEPGPLDTRPRIGIVSQSGGLGYALYNRGRVEGLDFSAIVSIGNQADHGLAQDLLVATEHRGRGPTRTAARFSELFPRDCL